MDICVPVFSCRWKKQGTIENANIHYYAGRGLDALLNFGRG